MKPKKYKVMIDIYKGVLNNQLIEFTTQDHGSNVLEFEILEDKVTPYNLDGCLVRMVINGQQQDCTIADATNGLVNITLHQSMFSEVGPVFAELQIYDALNQTIRLTTPIFRYTVKKSLMDDETVQADPNYSILQNMILEVSSADELAKQAKTIAEKSLETANQAKAKAQEIMANGDYAKEQGNYAKAEGDRLQGMLTLNGDAQTKFDFIENKVVNGVGSQISTTEKNLSINISTIKRIVYKGSYYNISGIKNLFKFGGIILGIDSSNVPYLTSNETGYKGLGNLVFTNAKEVKVIVEFIDNRTIEVMFFNGADKTISVVEFNSELSGNTVYLYGRENVSGSCVCSTTGEENEIQHNFSVLDNQQSIKELHTTDSTGKTSILKLASDEDHVEMASGRTLREEYMGVLKAMGKEVPSADGSPIEVNNGIKARLISGEIKGQTVKCISKLLKYTHDASTGRTKDVNLQLEKAKYTFSVEVTENVGNNILGFIFKDGARDVYKNIPINGVGFFKNVIDLSTCINNPRLYAIYATESGVSGSNKLVEQVNILYGEVNLITGLVDKGLSSTQAIVSNNGQQYPIYANEEDKANKKVISLGGVGDVKDTLEILEDGSAIWVQNTKEIVLNGSENITNETSVNKINTLYFMIQTGDDAVKNTTNNNAVSSNFKSVSASMLWNNDEEAVSCDTVPRIRIDRSKLTTQDVAGFKEYLKSNSLTVRYKLATPIITHIPKEIVPTIRTHNQTNILDFGGAVKPSSFKITVPVDRIAEIEARLQALESTTVDVVLNK